MREVVATRLQRPITCSVRPLGRGARAGHRLAAFAVTAGVFAGAPP